MASTVIRSPPRANVENLTLLGGSGASARGNDLANIITGNDGNNRIDGGAANDVLTGGAGRDTFVIHQGEGSDVITDFQTSSRSDTVALSGFGFQNFSDVAAALHQVGSDTILDLGDGSILTFRGSQATSFSANNFSLGVDTASLVQTFNDDFSDFDRFSDGSGTWRTRFEWWGDGAFTLPENGEQQIYVDTDFRGLTGTEQDAPLGYNPFSIVDGQLVITAEPITDPSAATKQYEFTSGMISTQSSFCADLRLFRDDRRTSRRRGRLAGLLDAAGRQWLAAGTRHSRSVRRPAQPGPFGS